MNKNPRVTAVIFARMNSTRLPGKVLKKIGSKPLLLHTIERLKSSQEINQIVLAIPDNKKNDILEEFAKKNSINFFRGSEENVLERFYLAAKESKADVVVEVPADKPLIDPEIIDLAIRKNLEEKADFTCTDRPEKFLPLGLDVGVLNFKALKKAYKNAQNREHITTYFYKNPKVFKINSVPFSKSLRCPNLRLTIDTKADFELINKIYEGLYQEGKTFKTKEILSFLRKNPELKKINSHIIQKA